MAGATQRAYKAGLAMAASIIEMVHLFYQNNTTAHFYKALYKIIKKEMIARNIIRQPDQLNRKTTNKIAEEIYNLIFIKTSNFDDAGKDCKAFYRKIAKWHLSKLKENKS